MGGISPCNSTDCQVILFVTDFSAAVDKGVFSENSHGKLPCFPKSLEEHDAHEHNDPRHADDDKGSHEDDHRVDQGGLDLGLSAYLHDSV